MKLHLFPPSPNAKKPLFVNAHLELGAEINVIDLQKGDQHRPDFVALNPNAKMPVLEFADGASLWESNAIINRMAAERQTTLWPDTMARYDIMRWQFWEMAHWAPICGKWLAKTLFGREIDLEAERPEFDRLAAVLNGHLDGRDWLVGDDLTTADISVAAVLSYREPCQMPLADYPNINRWMAAIEALPAWKAANPMMEPA